MRSDVYPRRTRFLLALDVNTPELDNRGAKNNIMLVALNDAAGGVTDNRQPRRYEHQSRNVRSTSRQSLQALR